MREAFRVTPAVTKVDSLLRVASSQSLELGCTIWRRFARGRNVAVNRISIENKGDCTQLRFPGDVPPATFRPRHFARRRFARDVSPAGETSRAKRRRAKCRGRNVAGGTSPGKRNCVQSPLFSMEIRFTATFRPRAKRRHMVHPNSKL